LLLARTDPSGALLWARSYGASTTGYSVASASDGGLVVAGVSGSALTIVKTDAGGDDATCTQAVPMVTVAAAAFRTGTNTSSSTPGCQASSVPVAVTVDPSPAASAGPAGDLCAPGSLVIGGSPSAAGGTPPYAYSWSALPPDASMSCTTGPACANPSVGPALT